MMMSLFSVFDPVAMMGVQMNWLYLVIIMIILPLSGYGLSGKVEEVYGGVINGVEMMFKEISSPSFLGVTMLGMGLFVGISMMNILGLFPFIYSGTSHLVVTLSMGLVIWMSFFIMGWFSNFNLSSAHLVPEGSPYVLAPFMVVIESISHIIRPITLSVRLAANMMAGHLIIGLISTMSMISYGGMWVSVILQSMMLVLEWAVGFIQAFVFSVLVLLYALEYY